MTPEQWDAVRDAARRDAVFYGVGKPRSWWQRLMFWRRPKADQWTPEQIEALINTNAPPQEINRIVRFYKPPKAPDT